MTKLNWRSLLDKRRELSSRERTMLASLCLVATMVVAAQAVDWDVQTSQSRMDALLRRQSAEAELAEAGNKALQEEISRAAEKLRRWSIVAPVEGVAQAAALAEVEALAQQAGLTNSQVSLEADTRALPSRVRSLSVRLSADFEWASMLRLLRAMKSARLSFAAESIETRSNATQQPTINMVLRVPFIAAEGRS